MKSKVFGTIVAGAVAGLMAGGVAMAKDPKAAAPAGKCMAKDNTCAGHISVKMKDKEVKNACGGKPACQGVTQADCGKAGGNWVMDKAAPAPAPAPKK